ncbi:unnamed protein product [Prorocentrum cordatum]|uniref:Uncharacterized protein n=1 Tax=Prorocentrum cordatum TaxID=2364126 RepID=A0ABN9UJ01_9DINO|nr:unnamed protein product [Polarella glacialis]
MNAGTVPWSEHAAIGMMSGLLPSTSLALQRALEVVAQGVDPRPNSPAASSSASVTASPMTTAHAVAPAHRDAISEQQIKIAARTLHILHPVISADRRDMILWMLNNPACLLGADDELLGADDELSYDAELGLLPDPGVLELLGDGRIFLELLAAEDAMLRDMEDDGDPTFGDQVIVDASLHDGARLFHAEDPAGASADVEGACSDHAPFVPAALVAVGGADGASSSATAHDALFPDFDPADNIVVEGDVLMLDYDGVANRGRRHPHPERPRVSRGGRKRGLTRMDPSPQGHSFLIIFLLLLLP